MTLRPTPRPADRIQRPPHRIENRRGFNHLFSRLLSDRRTAASNAAFATAMKDAPPGLLSVSIGGGPSRASPLLRNLNIALLPNVDIVATAYALPFPNGSLHGIHCEAVIEHLELPEVAVAEMYRVLRPGGQVFAATPFLQGYHGFPGHFQNFTLDGHRRLFERAGFAVASSGVCVGPCVALADFLTLFSRELLPGDLFRRLVARAVSLLLLPLPSVPTCVRHRPRSSLV